MLLYSSHFLTLCLMPLPLGSDGAAPEGMNRAVQDVLLCSPISKPHRIYLVRVYVRQVAVRHRFIRRESHSSFESINRVFKLLLIRIDNP